MLGQVLEALDAMKGQVDPDDIISIIKQPNGAILCTVKMGSATDKYMVNNRLYVMNYKNVVFDMENLPF